MAKGSPSGSLSLSTDRVTLYFGTWRSLVAHLLGVQGVASSNLAVPTINDSGGDFERISDPPAWRLLLAAGGPFTGA